MKHLMEKLELGGIKKDVTFLVISGIAVICSLLKWNPLPFDMAWIAIVLSDTLRRESADTIAAVTILGVQPVLLTGDHKNAVRTIAGELQIREVRANCLPENKLRYIAVDAADIALAIIGTLNPVAGALVHNAGSVLVITNSALLLKWRKK